MADPNDKTAIDQQEAKQPIESSEMDDAPEDGRPALWALYALLAAFFVLLFFLLWDSLVGVVRWVWG